MTDEQIYQILRKHILEYESKNARVPYGWFTDILDAQKEIQAEAMRLDSIEFADWVSVSGWERYSGDDSWVNRKNIESTTDQLYNEYLKTKQ